MTFPLPAVSRIDLFQNEKSLSTCYSVFRDFLTHQSLSGSSLIMTMIFLINIPSFNSISSTWVEGGISQVSSSSAVIQFLAASLPFSTASSKSGPSASQHSRSPMYYTLFIQEKQILVFVQKRLKNCLKNSSHTSIITTKRLCRA